MIFCVVVDHDPMAYIAYALQGISLALIFTAGQLPNKFSIFPFSECHLPVDIRIWQWRLEHPRTPGISGFDFVSIYASLGLGFATLMMLCHILRSVMGKLCHFVTSFNPSSLASTNSFRMLLYYHGFYTVYYIITYYIIL